MHFIGVNDVFALNLNFYYLIKNTYGKSANKYILCLLGKPDNEGQKGDNNIHFLSIWPKTFLWLTQTTMQNLIKIDPAKLLSRLIQRRVKK